jgi:SOS-response transcriptional repressor LexA
MNTLASNLKQLLQDYRLSESELARQTNIDQSVVHRLANNKTKNPKLDTLTALAKHFSISISQLIGDDLLLQGFWGKLQKNKLIKAIPILNLDTIENWLDKKETQKEQLDFIVTDLNLGENFYATQIQDSTMLPQLNEGTYLIVSPEIVSKNKDIVIFRKQNSQQAGVRQLFIDNEDKYLKSFNPDFKTIMLEPGDRLLGTVVQARSNYKDFS